MSVQILIKYYWIWFIWKARVTVGSGNSDVTQVTSRNVYPAWVSYDESDLGSVAGRRGCLLVFGHPAASVNRFPCLLLINKNIKRYMLCRNSNPMNLRMGGNTVILLSENFSIMYLFYSIGSPPLEACSFRNTTLLDGSSHVHQVTDLRLKPLWQESKVLLWHLSCYHLSVHPLLHRLVRAPWVRFYSNLGSLLEMPTMTCQLRWITEIAIWVLKCPMCTL